MHQAATRASFTRCLLVLLTVTAGAATVVASLLPDLMTLAVALRRGAVGERPFDDVLVLLCELAIGGCAVWLWAATTVVATAAARGGSRRPRGIPGAVLRIVLAACGVALAVGLATPAQAGDGAGTAPLDGLPLPDRATTTTHVSQVFARAARRDAARTIGRSWATVVVVRPGDTLWALARADLPADVGDGAVLRLVRQLHRVNRSVIGPDPDLIHPRQRLRLPRHPRIREEQHR